MIDRLTVAGLPDVVDIALFTGQSNMVGRETGKYECSIPDGMAFEFRMNAQGEKLAAVKNPVGETFGNVEASSGSSIVPGFCAAYVGSTGRKIVAVHAARGGRPISDFARGGVIYKDIVSKYRACLDYIENDGRFTVGHKFYIMMQGESDTNGTPAATYKSLYMEFHNGLKKEFGFEFGAILYTGRNTAEDREGVIRISNAKKELAGEHDDLIIVSKSAMVWYIESKEAGIREAKDEVEKIGIERARACAEEASLVLIVFDGSAPMTAKRG